jgi:hypothetical protein
VQKTIVYALCWFVTFCLHVGLFETALIKNLQDLKSTNFDAMRKLYYDVMASAALTTCEFVENRAFAKRCVSGFSIIDVETDDVIAPSKPNGIVLLRSKRAMCHNNHLPQMLASDELDSASKLASASDELDSAVALASMVEPVSASVSEPASGMPPITQQDLAQDDNIRVGSSSGCKSESSAGMSVYSPLGLTDLSVGGNNEKDDEGDNCVKPVDDGSEVRVDCSRLPALSFHCL